MLSHTELKTYLSLPGGLLTWSWAVVVSACAGPRSATGRAGTWPTCSDMTTLGLWVRRQHGLEVETFLSSLFPCSSLHTAPSQACLAPSPELQLGARRSGAWRLMGSPVLAGRAGSCSLEGGSSSLRWAHSASGRGPFTWDPRIAAKCFLLWSLWHGHS